MFDQLFLVVSDIYTIKILVIHTYLFYYIEIDFDIFKDAIKWMSAPVKI